MFPRPSKGFTLVEFLVAIATIGILVALMLPTIQMAREAARRMSCTNNLKQIGLAMATYHNTCRSFPSGWIGIDPPSGRPHASGQPGWAWGAMLLPYIEQRGLHKQIDFSRPITAPINDGMRRSSLSIYQCPSESGPEILELKSAYDPSVIVASLATSNYVGCFGTRKLAVCQAAPIGVLVRSDGVFQHNKPRTFRDMTDGTSSTIMVGERSAMYGASTWLGFVADGIEAHARFLGTADRAPNADRVPNAAREQNADRAPSTEQGHHLESFSSSHPQGVNFQFVDGSVRMIMNSVDLRVYRALATRQGGEMTPAPQ